jgi:YbbR domain-containing protein
MSHFSQIKTQIRNLTSLQAALTDLEIDWKSGPREVRGYQGQTHTAEVVIEQDNGYDIGFVRNNQDYELVADLQFWHQDLSVEGFLRQVTQRYAYNTVVNETAQKGFQVAEQQNQADGSIRLVLQRWSA